MLNGPVRDRPCLGDNVFDAARVGAAGLGLVQVAMQGGETVGLLLIAADQVADIVACIAVSACLRLGLDLRLHGIGKRDIHRRHGRNSSALGMAQIDILCQLTDAMRAEKQVVEGPARSQGRPPLVVMLLAVVQHVAALTLEIAWRGVGRIMVEMGRCQHDLRVPGLGADRA